MQKFIEKEVFQGYEHIPFKDNIVEGRIEWDDRYETEIPKFIIDGQEYALEYYGNKQNQF